MSANTTIIEIQSDLSRYSKFGALVIAWFVTFTIGSIAQSQFVLFELQSLGININGNLWLEHTVLDWWGLLPKYGGAIFVALCVAFLMAEYFKKYLQSHYKVLFSLAGGTAMLVLLISLYPILNVTLVAGTRTFGGQLSQCFAGATGGFLYAILRLELARWVIQRPKQNSSV